MNLDRHGIYTSTQFRGRACDYRREATGALDHASQSFFGGEGKRPRAAARHAARIEHFVARVEAKQEHLREEQVI
jgi:hypothetical protein